MGSLGSSSTKLIWNTGAIGGERKRISGTRISWSTWHGKVWEWFVQSDLMTALSPKGIINAKEPVFKLQTLKRYNQERASSIWNAPWKVNLRNRQNRCLKLWVWEESRKKHQELKWPPLQAVCMWYSIKLEIINRKNLSAIEGFKNWPNHQCRWNTKPQEAGDVVKSLLREPSPGVLTD